MRFMYDSYDKLFPRPAEAPEVIETAVPGFTPTSDAIQASDSTPAAPPADPTPAPAPIIQVQPEQPAVLPQPEPACEPAAETE